LQLRTHDTHERIGVIKEGREITLPALPPTWANKDDYARIHVSVHSVNEVTKDHSHYSLLRA